MRSNTRKWILSLVGLLIICIFLFPIYWMIISSLKSINEVFLNPPTLFPKEITFNAYKKIFSPEYQFYKYIINSFIISGLTMIFTIALATPAAYALARKKLKGASLMIMFVLIIQMFPPNMLALPIFSIFTKLGLDDTYLGVIIANMTIGMPFVILVLRTSFLALPKELEGAAMVDGCGKWRTFFSVILPITKIGVMTSAAFSFIFAWGEFMYSLILLDDQAKWPITLGLRQFDGQHGTQWGELMAIAVISSLPILIIFVFTQKYIVSGVAAGAVKE